MSVLIPLLLMAQRSPSAGDLSRFYNPRREVTISGTVTGKTKGQAPGYNEGMSILVRTKKKVQEVEVGPTWFVGRQSAAINLGDKVKITGVPLVIDKRESVIVARQIVRGRSLLALRDRTGMPFWTARRDANYAMDQGSGAQRTGNMYRGTIGDMKTYTINGEQYRGYVLNTPNGPVDFAVAPSWYLDNQPNYFNSGDNVTFFAGNNGARLNNIGGSNGRLPNTNGVVILNSALYGGGSLSFTSGGFPVYGGFQNNQRLRP